MNTMKTLVLSLALVLLTGCATHQQSLRGQKVGAGLMVGGTTLLAFSYTYDETTDTEARAAMALTGGVMSLLGTLTWAGALISEPETVPNFTGAGSTGVMPSHDGNVGPLLRPPTVEWDLEMAARFLNYLRANNPDLGEGVTTRCFPRESRGGASMCYADDSRYCCSEVRTGLSCTRVLRSSC